MTSLKETKYIKNNYSVLCIAWLACFIQKNILTQKYLEFLFYTKEILDLVF